MSACARTSTAPIPITGRRHRNAMVGTLSEKSDRWALNRRPCRSWRDQRHTTLLSIPSTDGISCPVGPSITTRQSPSRSTHTHRHHYVHAHARRCYIFYDSDAAAVAQRVLTISARMAKTTENIKHGHPFRALLLLIIIIIYRHNPFCKLGCFVYLIITSIIIIIQPNVNMHFEK